MSETVEAALVHEALRQRIADLEHNVAAWQKVADENIARRRELEAEVEKARDWREKYGNEATLLRERIRELVAEREVTESNMRELERELGEVRAELEGRR